MNLINKYTLILLLSTVSFAQKDSCVILLHGLSRSASSFENMSDTLSQKGYRVYNTDYESRKYNINDLANKVIPPVLDKTKNCDKLHFVTHSLGGIIVRQYLSENSISNLANVVMLGPPNHGSEVSDNLKDWHFYEYITGLAGQELTTDSTSVPNRLNSLGKPNFELGIIAGDRSINWINSMMIDGSDDGKVSVESSKLEGMKDHIVIHTTHPTMLNNDSVIFQVQEFLKFGRFK